MESENPATMVADTRATGQQKIQEKVGQVTTHIKNIDGELIAWDAVKEALLKEKITVPMAADRFKLKRKTIYEKCHRQGWKPIHAKTRGARIKLASKVADKIIKVGAEGVNWNEAGETHRQVAFEIAHQSVAKFKPRAPKNFRELEAADKMARRAAGLETAEVIAPTLIQVNELINEAEPQVFEIKSAEVVPTQDLSGATLAEALPQSP